MYTINSYYYQTLWLKVFDYTDGTDLFFGTLQNGAHDLYIDTPVGHEINVELSTYAKAYDYNAFYTSSSFSLTYGATEEPYCLLPIRIARITPTYYSTLQAAYDAAGDGEIIQSQANVFYENLFIDFNKTVTFEGGYDCYYATRGGNTILNGVITISNGTVILENFILQ